MAKKSEKEGGEKVIKMTGRQCQIAVVALKDLSENRMPIQTAVAVGRLLTALNEYAEPLEKALRELFLSKSAGQQAMKQDSKGFREFNEESAPLFDEEYEIAVVPVKASTIESIEGIEVKPSSWTTLCERGLLSDK